MKSNDFDVPKPNIYHLDLEIYKKSENWFFLERRTEERTGLFFLRLIFMIRSLMFLCVV
jgi:hypothetical protein